MMRGTPKQLIAFWRERAEAKRKLANSYRNTSRTQAIILMEAYTLEQCARQLEEVLAPSRAPDKTEAPPLPRKAPSRIKR